MENITFEIIEPNPKRDKHLKSVSEYQKRNPQKCRDKYNSYYNRLKYLNPEKYKLMLEKKRQNAQKSKIHIEKSNSLYNNQEI